MKKYLATGLLLAFVGSFWVLVALGADSKGPAATGGTKNGRDARRLMRSMDADGDNKISPDEYKAWRYREAHRWFAYEDANGDGKIDPNEYTAARVGGERARFYWLDTANKNFTCDGVIDRAEATEENISATDFAKRDVNGDGKIDWPEWQRAWLAEVKLMFTKHGVTGEGGMTFVQAYPKLDKDISADFASYDANGDGFISEQEFVDSAVRIARQRAIHLFNEIDEE